MANEAILLGLAAVVVLGVAVQWLAWRLRQPSILLLLLAGFALGALTEVLDPDALLGDLLLPIVSLSVGIILFEGGLSLSFREIRGHGPVVTRLVTVGALVTWLLAAVAARHLAGLSWSLSLLLGAIVVVTGPTVIGPLLRFVRPRGDAGAVVKWEGILIDPVGALLALLVFDAVSAATPGAALVGVALTVLKAVGAGVAVGAAGAFLLYLVLRHERVPSFLESPVTLAMVVAVFVAADLLQSEAGLLSVTVMGVALANQSRVQVHRIAEFKENLRVLLIAGLFLLLAARIRIDDLRSLGWGSILFIGALLLVVRPASVLASTAGSALSWRERAWIAWLAPRGIVAAAVSSVFALRLAEAGFEGAEELVPLVFLVIVATVAIYGLTSRPLARALGLAGPSPQGALVVGAHPFARALARRLREAGHRVLLVDTNPQNVAQAHDEGLDAVAASALSEEFQEELDAEGLGRLLAMTPNDQVNALAARTYDEWFGREEVYQLAPRRRQAREMSGEAADRLRGKLLFGKDVALVDIERRMGAGDGVHALRLRAGQAVPELRGPSGQPCLPLLFIADGGRVAVGTAAQPLQPKGAGTLVYLGGEHPPQTPLPPEVPGARG